MKNGKHGASPRYFTQISQQSVRQYMTHVFLVRGQVQREDVAILEVRMRSVEQKLRARYLRGRIPNFFILICRMVKVKPWLSFSF